MIAAALAVIAVSACSERAEERYELVYPETEKVDQVDDYFGVMVEDPYRWLEDDESPEVAGWVEAQNDVTFSYLERIPFRDELRERIAELYDYPKYSSPMRAGDHYFFYLNDGLQDQSVIYVQRGLEGEPEVFIDPNALSADGTVRIHLTGFSGDDRYVAYSRSEAGSDWRELRVREISTGEELEDRIEWVKFSGASWYGDGFFYGAYEEPGEGEELKGRNSLQKLYYHALGTGQDDDILVYEDPEHPLRFVSADVSEDESWIFLYVSEGTSGNELHFRRLEAVTGEFTPIVTGFESDSRVVGTVDEGFLVMTDLEAPNSRVVLVDPGEPSPGRWKTVIPEKEEVLRGVSSAGGYLFCSYLEDAYAHIYQYRTDGEMVREISLPAPGTARGFRGESEDTVLFYTFSSFTYPPTIFSFDVSTGESNVFRKTEVGFDPGDFTAKQVFYRSKDGTSVPMFIVHRKGIEMDGENPAYLTGYGGFQASMTPRFYSTRVALLERGCVMAIPNLRGGGEYGEEWHEAGMLLDKQNVFDDFIAAAEYLIEEGYTSSDRLAIAGGSNGGLLVGACMNQRPDLFAVALPAVGVMDMLRYHKFTIGWGWVVEYGSSDEEEHFHNLLSYSPLHNIREGVDYPATLVTTADHDDRVVPAHSFKFIATLQEKHAGNDPVLIRIETRSGHGSVSTGKMIDELADEYAFMLHNVGYGR